MQMLSIWKFSEKKRSKIYSNFIRKKRVDNGKEAVLIHLFFSLYMLIIGISFP
jgi:hypothetical protein